VTDSAASATAYSCGIKTYNGAIGIDEDGNPCGTVLEAAKRAGFKTGLVVTSRLTHATPASFASHIYDRDQEDKIAEQLIGDQPLGAVVDVMLGGGLAFFWYVGDWSCSTEAVPTLLHPGRIRQLVRLARTHEI
jgi:alkaline phosphatase